jgi:hypothetical protein
MGVLCEEFLDRFLGTRTVARDHGMAVDAGILHDQIASPRHQRMVGTQLLLEPKELS